MTFRGAVNKAMDRVGTARVRRRSWARDDLGWTLTVSGLNGGIWWSHRSPCTDWVPKWDDLDATDWEAA